MIKSNFTSVMGLRYNINVLITTLVHTYQRSFKIIIKVTKLQTDTEKERCQGFQNSDNYNPVASTVLNSFTNGLTIIVEFKFSG